MGRMIAAKVGQDPSINNTASPKFRAKPFNAGPVTTTQTCVQKKALAEEMENHSPKHASHGIETS